MEFLSPFMEHSHLLAAESVCKNSAFPSELQEGAWTYTIRRQDPEDSLFLESEDCDIEGDSSHQNTADFPLGLREDDDFKEAKTTLSHPMGWKVRRVSKENQTPLLLAASL